MSRPAALLVASALVLAACAGSPDAASTESSGPSPDAPVATSTTEASTAPTTVPTQTEPTPAASPPVSGVDGPPAPSDAVPSAAGADILLSQEVLPVYLIFWAEW